MYCVVIEDLSGKEHVVHQNLTIGCEPRDGDYKLSSLAASRRINSFCDKYGLKLQDRHILHVFAQYNAMPWEQSGWINPRARPSNAGLTDAAAIYRELFSDNGIVIQEMD